MTRYYMHATQAEAQATVDHVDAVARTIYAAQGYTITPEGDVVGKRDGVDDPNGVTSTWDIPRQIADGRWVVTHPEAHPSAAFDTAHGTVLELITDGITAPIESAGSTWWPVATP